jgi:hypothetical protein
VSHALRGGVIDTFCARSGRRSAAPKNFGVRFRGKNAVFSRTIHAFQKFDSFSFDTRTGADNIGPTE